MKMFEKDAVPGRDDACGLRATGLHSVPCGTGARPRVNLTRYHDVLAQNHRWRAEVTPVGRGDGRARPKPERWSIEPHAAMRWAQWLKRVFDIDVESRVRCGKTVPVIASIEVTGADRADPGACEREGGRSRIQSAMCATRCQRV